MGPTQWKITLIVSNYSFHLVQESKTHAEIFLSFQYTVLSFFKYTL